MLMIICAVLVLLSNSVPNIHSHLLSSSNIRAAPFECFENKCPEKDEYNSIKFLHNQLDDDANGDIDVTETAEFLRDELQYANGNERRKGFHRNDKHISLSELWQSWKSSEVHNWTIDDTLNWLKTSVELPQYAQAFQDHKVNGTSLPRLATNNAQFITNILKIKDPIHRQKIVLKAMDAVLFGPARADRNFIKDTVLVLLFVIAVGGCFFAYIQHRYSQKHLKKMIADMEALQKAEDALTDLQQELDKARQEQSNVADEKRQLEKRLKHESSKDLNSIISEDECHVQIRILEDQKQQLQNELERAERLLKQQQTHWTAPPTLQLWLQLTYEIEQKNFSIKRNAAEQQLMIARDGCEKLRKKKAQMFGSLRIAHGNSIDDIDHKIVEAKSALSEVTQELRERAKRWKQIEALCGFGIAKNPGLSYLQSMLHGNLSQLNVFNSARAILAGKENSESTLEDECSAGSLSRDRTFPISLHSVSQQSSPTGEPLVQQPSTPKRSVTIEQIVESGINDSSEDLVSNISPPTSEKPVFSLGSPCDSNSQSFGKTVSVQPVVAHPDQPAHIQSNTNQPQPENIGIVSDVVTAESIGEQHNILKQTKSNPRAPNSRQSSSDSFNQVLSSHENSVSPPPSHTSSRKKISNIFRNKLPLEPSSPEDCSTDSGSVKEEVIRHKKKKMFLHLRKSKPKLA